jgi:hypothetical protein
MFFSKENSLYRPIFKQALEITWRNKFLWVFGFFAAFLSSGGVYDVIIKNWNTVTARTIELKSLLTLATPSSFEYIHKTSGEIVGKLNIYGFAAGLLIALFIMAAFCIMALISQGGIIHAVSEISSGKKTSWKKCFDIGLRHIFQIFGINLSAKIIIFFLLLSIGLPAVVLFPEGSIWSDITFFVIFLISIPLTLVVLFTMIYSVAGLVIQKYSLFESIKESLKLLKEHWIISLEMARFLLFFSLAFGIVVSVGLVFVATPFLLLGAALNLLIGTTGMAIAFTAAIVLFIAFVAVLGSGFISFQLGCWALLYNQLANQGGVSKIIRILADLPKRLKL